MNVRTKMKRWRNHYLSKNTDVVIRSMEASTIYNMGRPEGQIQDYLAKKNEELAAYGENPDDYFRTVPI